MPKKSIHQWGNFLNLKDVIPETGGRSVTKNSIYDPESRITVSKELAHL
ncbi:MAG: hypothetical protein JXR52_08645 [Bacteroidales bacterium]|nr:hypothetical protein [Bacteroidales bacterium]MBN2698880.1 hypothetical protein [Bacteroidales bacterium]